MRQKAEVLEELGDRWQDNSIQFPRLISEILATQELDMPALCHEMDLDLEDLNELFDRAQTAWQNHLAFLLNGS